MIRKPRLKKSGNNKGAFLSGGRAFLTLIVLIRCNLAFNISGEYGYIEIKENNFDKEIQLILKDKNLTGLNITTPYKEKIIQDERDDLISSKSYKLGYLLYELSLFLFIGILASDSSFQNSGPITFIILLILLIVSLIKSLFQLYLYRTS